jgi:hypothetical protein
MSAHHTCSKCGHPFELPTLPGPSALLTSPRNDFPLAEQVYAVCPNCGQKDWAVERRFFGVFGPKALYGFVLALAIAFVAAAAYSLFLGQ